MNLSANFTLSELTKSQQAVRLGIDNTPNVEQLEALKLLALRVLQPVRNNFGKTVIVSSGLRVKKLNKAIGGANNSEHTEGKAADIEIPGVPNKVLAIWIRDNLKFTQLILEGYIEGQPDSGWVHVSYDPLDLKCQCLTATFVKGKVYYKNGI